MSADQLPRDLVASLMEQPARPTASRGESPPAKAPQASGQPRCGEDLLPIGGDLDYSDAVAHEDWHADTTWSIKAREW